MTAPTNKKIDWPLGGPQVEWVRDNGDTELRLSCLAEANATAKLGLSSDVFATAERYYRFATGQPTADPLAALTFPQRLDALTAEFLREEKSDQRKMLHELREYVKSYEAAFGPVTDAEMGEIRKSHMDAEHARDPLTEGGIVHDILWPVGGHTGD